MPAACMRRPAGNVATLDHGTTGADVSPRAGQSTDADRYRKAADLVVEQLDWVIDYLHQLRKHELARALRRNRMSIVKRYRGY